MDRDLGFRKRAVGIILLAILSQGACTRGDDAASVIQVQLSAEPVSLDPATAEDGVSMRVLHNTMEGLMGYDGAGVLQPRLSSRMTRSPDGLTYRFELRSGAKWSDGAPVKARDFVYGLRRTLEPGRPSKLGETLFLIRGARAMASGAVKNPPPPCGPAPPRSREGCFGAYEDGESLVFELEHPASHFPMTLATLAAMPARQDAIESAAGKWTSATPVTGPYRIARHKPDQELLLEPNPHYVFPEGTPSSVLLRIVSDESTGLNLFERGKIDVLTRVPSLDLERLKKTGVVRTDPFLATYFLGFNVRKAPFDRVEWRRAASAAIRRQEIVNALGGGERPATSWLPAGLEGHRAYLDPLSAEAPSVFREAVARVKPLAPRQRGVAAQFDASARNAMILEKVQADLKQGLGLKVELARQDWKAHVRSLSTDPAPIYRFGWVAIYRDPIFNLQAYTSGNPNNYTGWKDARYDRLVAEIESLEPSEARAAKIREADRILTEEAAIIAPLFHYVQVHAVSKRVQGFRVNPFGVIRFDELKVSR